MSRKLLNRRINGSALEQIMRDVLDGMQDVTHHAGAHSHTDGLEILGIEKDSAEAGQAAIIIPFPVKGRDS